MELKIIDFLMQIIPCEMKRISISNFPCLVSIGKTTEKINKPTVLSSIVSSLYSHFKNYIILIYD